MRLLNLSSRGGRTKRRTNVPASGVVVLRASTTSGVAPLGVVVDGVGTALGTNPFARLLYFVNWGDTGSGTYTYGANPGADKNKHLGGPVAAHCYETPGSYTVSMWAYDGTTLYGPATQAITVSNPDTVYAGADTIVVSTSGTFTGKPTGATEVTSSSASTTLATYAAANKRILFRDDETFTVAASLAAVSGGYSNLYIGRFGGGTLKPILKATATSVRLFGYNNTSNDANAGNGWRVNGIKFDGDNLAGTGAFDSGVPYTANLTEGQLAARPGFHTLSNVEFVNVFGGIAPWGRGHVLHKVTGLRMGNAAPSSGGNWFYVENGYQIGVVDCQFDNEQGGEHCFRVQSVQYMAVSGVTCKRASANKTYFTFRGDQSTDYATRYVVGNMLVMDGSAESGLGGYGTGPSSDSTVEHIEDIIIECSMMEGPTGMTGAVVEIGSGVQRFEFRNNAVYVRNTSVTTNPVSASYTSFSGQRITDDVRFINNSIRMENTGGTGIGMRTYAAPEDKTKVMRTVFKGNVMDISGFTTVYAVLGDGGSYTGTDSVITGNSTDGQAQNTSPVWTGAGTALSHYTLDTGSPYINAGANYGVYVDALGKLRNSGGNWDAGAVNSAAKNTDAWTLTA